MGPVWALLLLLLSITEGAEAPCDARQNNTQCYGALGGIMEIRLMDKGSPTDRCFWKKSKQTIFEWKNKKVTNETQKKYTDRAIFNSSTGIFQMKNLSKNDSDTYTLELVDANGISTKTIIELIIEAPVSSARVVQQCVSRGEMNVTCTAEGGDSPEFSWTLNGQTLTGDQLLSKNDKNNTITLKQDTKGLLRCSVKNHVNEVYEEHNISNCEFMNCTSNGTEISGWVPEANNTCKKQRTTSAPITPVGKNPALTPTTTNSVSTSDPSDPWYIRYWPIVVGALAGVFIIGMMAIAVICVLKKKRKKNRDEEEELTYADVRFVQQPGRRPQQQAPEKEVEYGQVKFSNQNHPVSEAADNACIYAKVQR